MITSRKFIVFLGSFLFILLLSNSHGLASGTIPEMAVFTEEAKDSSLVCESNLDFEEQFQLWLSNSAGALTEGLCDGWSSFAAIPNSYDPSDINTFPGISPGELNSSNCPSGVDGLLRYELVDFVFFDDCDNILITSAQFSIIDQTVPIFNYCPNDTTYVLSSANCSIPVTISVPLVEDNCGQLQPQIFRSIYKQVTASTEDEETIVDSLFFKFGPFDFTNTPISSDIELSLDLNNIDGNLQTEFFKVIGENNQFLGITHKTPEECGDTLTILTITKLQANSWLSDGYIEIYLAPNINADPVLAINNICPGGSVTASIEFEIDIQNNIYYFIQINEGELFQPSSVQNFDTTLNVGTYDIKYIFRDCANNESFCNSKITITENFNPSISCFNDTIITLAQNECTFIYTIPSEINYSDNCTNDHQDLQFFITGATNVFNTLIDDITVDIHLNVGDNLMNILSFDESMNSDTCQYTITIVDDQLPSVVCPEDTLYFPLSDSFFYNLDPTTYSALSSDNCSINNVIIEPNQISCAAIGTNKEIQLTIWDINGNVDSCSNTIFITSESLNISYDPITCEGDTLFLNSNIINENYTYQWTGPNGFNSNEQNPFIINPSDDENGVYELNVTNADNCLFTGSMEVSFELITQPQMFNGGSTICNGDDITLVCSSFSSNVTYKWYQGNQGNNVFLGNSSFNNFSVFPSLGINEYFVIVSGPNCVTMPSSVITIESIEKPIAEINSVLDKVCEGDTIKLESAFPDNFEYGYHWIGPNGYTSQDQNSFIYQADQSHDGFYHFIVYKGFCVSDTVSKRIIVNERPDKPIISSSGIFCEGNPVQLNAPNIPFADDFYWIKDGIPYTSTIENQLIIPTATNDLSGKWKVVALLGNCYSDTSYSHEILIEETLNVGISGPDKACVGDSVSFMAPFIPDAIYIWTGPNGFTYDQHNPKLLAIEGEYQLEIMTQFGCMNNATLFLEVDDIPDITAISNDAEHCTDGSSDILFSATVFPITDYAYLWTGPNGFSSNEINPVIENATSDVNGYYILVITNEFCNSKPDSSLIDINNTPSQAIIILDEEYCKGEDITLNLISETGENITYIWNTPTGQINTDVPSLTIENSSDNNVGEYSVYLERNNCLSVNSEKVLLTIRPTPDAINIIGENTICEGSSIILSASDLEFEEYEWTGPNGFSSNENTIIINNFTEDNNGAYFVRYFDGFCYSDWSIPQVVTLQSKPITAEIETISESVCIENGIINICLVESTLSPGAIYHVYEASNQLLLGSSSSNCFELSDIGILQTGTNHIYIQTELNGCPSDISSTKIINLDIPPNIEAQIIEGTSLLICNEENVFLNVQNENNVIFEWSSNSGLNFENPLSNSTLINNLSVGENMASIHYSFESCIDFSSDTIILFLEAEPVAFDDELTISYNGEDKISVLENDDFTDDVKITIVYENEDAEVKVVDQQIVVIPNSGFIGELFITYEICNLTCPDLCSEANIAVIVGNSNNCFAPNILTPNGDDINDNFTIPCLDNNGFPNNKLIIFNQWGDSVFEASPYNNDWSGTHKNEDLPTGTYFYILDLGDNNIIKGFIHIER